MSATRFSKSTTTSIRLRIGVAMALALLLVVGTRLVFIQGVDAAGQTAAAMNERLRSAELLPNRGAILDRSGRVLADSVQRYDLVADQRLNVDYRVWNNEINGYEDVDIDDALAELSSILDIPVTELKALMIGERHYRMITRGVTPEVKDQALALKIPGLISRPVSERTYPNGAVAGSILGFIGQEGEPLEGLELSQNSHLTGTSGERVFEISADGVRIPNASFSETPAVDGQDIRLTIDQDLQWFAQEAIAAKADEYKAQWANLTVTDIDGNILAMADSTTVDPANPSDTDPLFWRPTALTQAYEPGSTGKVPIFAAALNEGIVTPTDEFEVPNSQNFNGQIINDSMKHPTFDMTAAGIFTRSYNTGTVQVATKLSKEQRYEYLKAFGIGTSIDVGLPYSHAGLLANWQDWDGRQQYTTTFGQGYSLTSLHTSQITQTVANGGVMKTPRLIDAYIDPDGVEHVVDPGEGKRVISEEAAEEMLKLMEGVVEEGTATKAQVPGYRVGGKTGTGQAAGPTGGYDGHTTAFTAVAPLDDPQFIVTVAVYRPQGHWRTWDVTETAGDVMAYLLSKYNVPPSDAEPEYYDVFTEDPQERPWW